MRNFSIGKSTHMVDVYETYTKEEGLIGNPIIRRESGRISECLRGLPINKTQIETLRKLARLKEDMVVHPDGTLTDN
jgi:hypothetical protein